MTMAQAQSLDKLHRTKQMEIGKGNMFQVRPIDLLEQEGFNPRDYSKPDTVAHIRQLADAYKSGQFVPPVVVKVIDGQIYIRDGHCRRRAMLLAIEEGADLGLQPVQQFTGDDNDADLFVVTSQSGKKLTATELAFMYSRMVNRGKTEAEIAKAVGKTPQNVGQYLTVHQMPLEIKQLIDENVVSMSLALETFNEFGTAAINMLAEGVEVSLKAGKKKLTKKSLVAHQEANGHATVKPKITKKVISKMSEHAATWGPKFADLEYDESDMTTVQLTKEEVEALVALRELLAPSETAQAGPVEAPTDESGPLVRVA
ncbi:ParB/RepB/Spo0J family partition protein [Halomonas sp. KO116]|uniref:ParB/RepB/Spo0J family partition protein n=1 Tax=Halomonas sp. KO116 TaxID=1504981 RepID=UPI0004E4667C|nr:KorB domain-containing protein [Halomonas sp. KO116]AJY53269.1 KorB domain-containing protein [Halomonas sp. KO116]